MILFLTMLFHCLFFVVWEKSKFLMKDYYFEKLNFVFQTCCFMIYSVIYILFGLFWDGEEGERGGTNLHIVKQDHKVHGIQVIIFQSVIEISIRYYRRKLHNILFIKKQLLFKLYYYKKNRWLILLYSLNTTTLLWYQDHGTLEIKENISYIVLNYV